MGVLSLNTYALSKPEAKQEQLVFSMIYDTNKSIDIKKAVLYFSTSQWLRQKKDSLIINYKLHASPDSIIYNIVWEHPVFLQLKLYTVGQMLESHIFPNSAKSEFYDVYVLDSSLKVRPKLSNGIYERNSSLKALILVLQAIIEMIIAFLIVKGFGISRLLVLMVLVANIAAYPLYLFNFSVLNREALVFLIKVGVMSLIGIRKIKIHQIITIVAVLTLISLGIKEFLFFIITMI